MNFTKREQAISTIIKKVRGLLLEIDDYVDHLDTLILVECDTTEDASDQEDQESLHDFSEAAD